MLGEEGTPKALKTDSIKRLMGLMAVEDPKVPAA